MAFENRIPEENDAPGTGSAGHLPWQWLGRTGRELDRLTGENIVFIVGPPRSGTTWLQRLVAAHPRVRTGQESFVFAWYIGQLERKWHRDVRRQTGPDADRRRGVGLGAYLTREDFYRTLRLPIAQMLAAVELEAGDVFVEKTPSHTHWIPEIKEVLPKAKFVSIVRDPRDVVASLYVASQTWGSEWAPSRVRLAARQWVEAVQHIRKARAVLGDEELLSVTYEALSEAPVETMQRVFDFLSLPWAADEIADAVARNSAENVRRGGGTPLPLYGHLRAEKGAVAVEPEGFVGPAQVGGNRQRLSLLQRTFSWIEGRKMAEAEGYPSDWTSWLFDRR